MAKTKKEKLECRIRYVEDWCGNGEHFVFENKWPDDEEWGLDSAFPICEIKDRAYENPRATQYGSKRTVWKVRRSGVL